LIAQRRYKALARAATVTSFLAVTIAGMLLRPALVAVSPLVLTGLAALQFVLILTSFSASLVIAFRKPFPAWMRKRAEAENARNNLFKRFKAAEENVQANELHPPSLADGILSPLPA
jgi:hypothetical protein